MSTPRHLAQTASTAKMKARGRARAPAGARGRAGVLATGLCAPHPHPTALKPNSCPLVVPKKDPGAPTTFKASVNRKGNAVFKNA